MNKERLEEIKKQFVFGEESERIFDEFIEKWKDHKEPAPKMNWLEKYETEEGVKGEVTWMLVVGWDEGNQGEIIKLNPTIRQSDLDKALNYSITAMQNALERWAKEEEAK